MKKTIAVVVFAALAACGKEPAPPTPPLEAPKAAAPAPAAAAASPADLEKQKALAEPYANDFGPQTLDVSAYPPGAQDGYSRLQAKCTSCHTAARPLNSQFVEPSGADISARQAAVAKLKGSSPELFAPQNKAVWQVEADIWQRYVKRMMSKPGCTVTKDDGKVIWEFLVQDSQARKLGANRDAWAKHRRALLEQFKKEHPGRHKALYGG